MPLLMMPFGSTFPTSSAHAARVAVEFSPGVGPTGIPVWEDITTHVKSITYRRGRQRLLDRFETGTATIVLDNRDRRFDPTYTAGPYFGQLLPMRRFRIRAQHNNATYPRFDGYVENWAQTYEKSDTNAECVVTVSDAFKVLALAKPTSPWSASVAALNPTAWYRLSESESAAGMRDSSANALDGTYVGAPSMGQAGLVNNDDNTCISVTGGAYGRAPVPMQARKFTEVALWFSTSSASDQTLVSWCDSSGNLMVEVRKLASGAVGFRYWASGTTYNGYNTTATTFADGNPHFIHFTIYIDANPPVSSPILIGSVDGVNTAYDFASFTFTSETINESGGANTLYVGTRCGVSNHTAGKLDEVVVIPEQGMWSLSGAVARMDNLYAAGTAPWSGDYTGTRIGRVLDAVSWPTDERDVDTGNSTLQAAEYGDGSALDHMQAVAQTEQGQFYITANGRVRFTARRSTIGAASAATFTENGGGGIPYADIELTYDESLIRNAVTAQRVGGGQVTVTDSDSVEAYFARTYEASGLLYNDDNQTRDFASWIVNRFAQPALRVEGMTLIPARNPGAIFPVLLNLELGDLVTVERTPQGVGVAISQDLMVEGIDETITPTSWVAKLRLSEADTSSYWILGDSTYGVLGSTTRLAF